MIVPIIVPSWIHCTKKMERGCAPCSGKAGNSMENNDVYDSDLIRMWLDARIDARSMIYDALCKGVEPFHLAEYSGFSLEDIYEIGKDIEPSIAERSKANEEELSRMMQDARNNMIARICDSLRHGSSPAFLSIYYHLPLGDIYMLQARVAESETTDSMNPLRDVDLIHMRQDAINQWNAMLDAAERKSKGESAAQIATGMKQDGVDPVFISKYSGLTLEEIAAL